MSNSWKFILNEDRFFKLVINPITASFHARFGQNLNYLSNIYVWNVTLINYQGVASCIRGFEKHNLYIIVIVNCSLGNRNILEFFRLFAPKLCLISLKLHLSLHCLLFFLYFVYVFRHISLILSLKILAIFLGLPSIFLLIFVFFPHHSWSKKQHHHKTS